MSGQPAFDFKANYLKFLNHEETPFIPNEFVGNSILGFGAINGPAIEKGGADGSPDGFGVYWVCPETGGGAAIPKPGQFLLDDICDWREKVTIPDASAFDWEAEAAKELANVDRNQTVVAFGFGNGVFERLAALMGFEEALLAIMEEPEEVYALFEAITDYKIQALDYIQKYYKPDVVTYYDDACHVVIECLLVKKITLLRLHRRVTDHAGRSTNKGDRLVSAVLEMLQDHDAHHMSDME